MSALLSPWWDRPSQNQFTSVCTVWISLVSHSEQSVLTKASLDFLRPNSRNLWSSISLLLCNIWAKRCSLFLLSHPLVAMTPLFCFSLHHPNRSSLDYLQMFPNSNAVKSWIFSLEYNFTTNFTKNNINRICFRGTYSWIHARDSHENTGDVSS